MLYRFFKKKSSLSNFTWLPFKVCYFPFSLLLFRRYKDEGKTYFSLCLDHHDLKKQQEQLEVYVDSVMKGRQLHSLKGGLTRGTSGPTLEWSATSITTIIDRQLLFLNISSILPRRSFQLRVVSLALCFDSRELQLFIR